MSGYRTREGCIGWRPLWLREVSFEMRPSVMERNWVVCRLYPRICLRTEKSRMILFRVYPLSGRHWLLCRAFSVLHVAASILMRPYRVWTVCLVSTNTFYVAEIWSSPRHINWVKTLICFYNEIMKKLKLQILVNLPVTNIPGCVSTTSKTPGL